MKKTVFCLMFGCLILNSFALKAQVIIQRPSNSISISTLPAYGWISYKKGNVRSKGDFDLSYGITYRHQLKPSSPWQIAFGLDYRTYTGIVRFNGLRDSVPMQDWAEDRPGVYHKYYFIQIFNNTEQQKVTYLEPNIRLEYTHPLASFVDLIVGFGLKYGINLGKESHKMTDGTYERNAYFYENHNFIDVLSSVKLDIYPRFLDSLQYQHVNTFFDHKFFALGEIGFRFKILPSLYLKTMINFQHSLLNIQSKQAPLLNHWDYLGIVSSEIPGGVRAISIGAEIGLSFRFVIPRKPPKPKMIRSIHCPH